MGGLCEAEAGGGGPHREAKGHAHHLAQHAPVQRADPGHRGAQDAVPVLRGPRLVIRSESKNVPLSTPGIHRDSATMGFHSKVLKESYNV